MYIYIEIFWFILRYEGVRARRVPFPGEQSQCPKSSWASVFFVASFDLKVSVSGFLL